MRDSERTIRAFSGEYWTDVVATDGSVRQEHTVFTTVDGSPTVAVIKNTQYTSFTSKPIEE